MLYGLIGEHLSHSYSCEIHASIADYGYILKEIPELSLEEFFKKREFNAINVTIPYKEKVMKYLDDISETARLVGSVNTVVKRGGRLYGYNTDFVGMQAMLKRHGIGLKNKKVLILGTGGTCKTALAVATAEGAAEVIKVSRRAENGAISYAEAYECHTDAEVIINTTPVGMYSRQAGKPIEISEFKRLSGVVDAIYNPLRTELISEATERGIPACGGLYMLAAQAVYASALFLGREADGALIDKAFSEVEAAKENIVLVGMPSSGKSTVGGSLAKALGRELFDSDAEIVREAGMEISDYFATYGEKAFREAEKAVISRLSERSGCVIATGGGAVLDKENIMHLKKNGRVYFLDRSIEKLISTPDRPLSSSPEALKTRYDERYPIYRSVCDEQVDGNKSVEAITEEIIKRHSERR